MSDHQRAPVPKGLTGRGRTLWRQLVDVFEFRPDELRILEQAGHVLNEIGQLERAVREHGLIVEGSKGQPRAHPLLVELRASRSLLARLLGQLGLPDEPEQATLPGVEVPASRERSTKARRAALARWGGR